MNFTETQLLETPLESDRIYVPMTEAAVPEKITWVKELIGYTVNGCFKVRDATGAVRIIKRCRGRDQRGQRAWISLN